MWRQDLAILSPEGPRDNTCQLRISPQAYTLPSDYGQKEITYIIVVSKISVWVSPPDLSFEINACDLESASIFSSLFDYSFFFFPFWGVSGLFWHFCKGIEET